MRIYFDYSGKNESILKEALTARRLPFDTLYIEDMWPLPRTMFVITSQAITGKTLQEIMDLGVNIASIEEINE